MRAGQLQLYIDGKLVATSPSFNYSEVFDIENALPLMIGFGAVDYFTGVMDELRIYNRALSAEEVVRLHRGER